jgi:DNA methylase
LTRDHAEGLTVWATGQRPSRVQRSGRYLPATAAHPAKMLPAIAAEVISRFTRPGEWVADPMCGIGTTLIEAVHAGRNAIGVEYEPRWAQLAVSGIAHARAQGAGGHGWVFPGDGRAVASLVLAELHGKVALVLTSPPYGDSTHGHAKTTRDSVTKVDFRYSRDPANLGYRKLDELFAAFTEILAASAVLLRPGGIVAVTARPIRRHGELTDIPGRVIDAAVQAGLEPAGRFAALICGLRNDSLITRASFFAMHETRRMRAKGLPAHVIAHEDLLIFRRPGLAAEDQNQKAAA